MRQASSFIILVIAVSDYKDGTQPFVRDNIEATAHFEEHEDTHDPEQQKGTDGDRRHP